MGNNIDSDIDRYYIGLISYRIPLNPIRYFRYISDSTDGWYHISTTPCIRQH